MDTDTPASRATSLMVATVFPPKSFIKANRFEQLFPFYQNGHIYNIKNFLYCQYNFLKKCVDFLGKVYYNTLVDANRGLQQVMMHK